jgi:transposase-like protein
MTGPCRVPNHKLWNLLAKAPAHLREELAEDYRRMIYAPSREAVEQARLGFLRKWKLRCKAVSASFEEAADELFTFRFPRLAVESLADHQRAGTDQRGVSTADQNPEFAAQ